MADINNQLEKIEELGVSEQHISKYQSELKSLERQHGYLTPQIVLDAARVDDSPLHSIFDWDDESASEKYRLMQARMLMTRVRVQIGDRRYGAYTNLDIVIDNVPVRAYVSTERALSDDELSKQVLGQAARELEYWQEKYRNYQELAGVISQEKLEEIKKKAE